MADDMRREKVQHPCPGSAPVSVVLEDHYTGKEINAARRRATAASATPSRARPRASSTRCASCSAARPWWHARAALLETVADPVSARLGDLPGPDAGRCRELRSELGIDASDDAPAFVRGDGTPVPAPELARFARMASLTAISLEANGGVCRSLLSVRYGIEEVAA